jgi:hypothetical protein
MNLVVTQLSDQPTRLDERERVIIEALYQP